MDAPTWWNKSEHDCGEQELKERLEYERAQLDMLKMDVANTEVRMKLLQERLHVSS